MVMWGQPFVVAESMHSRGLGAPKAAADPSAELMGATAMEAQMVEKDYQTNKETCGGLGVAAF